MNRSPGLSLAAPAGEPFETSATCTSPTPSRHANSLFGVHARSHIEVKLFFPSLHLNRNGVVRIERFFRQNILPPGVPFIANLKDSVS